VLGAVEYCVCQILSASGSSPKNARTSQPERPTPSFVLGNSSWQALIAGWLTRRTFSIVAILRRSGHRAQSSDISVEACPCRARSLIDLVQFRRRRAERLLLHRRSIHRHCVESSLWNFRLLICSCLTALGPRLQVAVCDFCGDGRQRGGSRYRHRQGCLDLARVRNYAAYSIFLDVFLGV